VVKFRADAARNREKILAAAAELFERDGVEAVTMDAVARAAGVSKGTVFSRFGSRAGLAMALLDEAERELQEQAQAARIAEEREARERAAAELHRFPEIDEFLAFFDRSDRGSIV